MGCVCCSLSSFVSIVLNACERITLCTVCALLTCCLLFTIITMLVMGIGIGFHYCTVQYSVEAMEKAAKAAGALRSGGRPENSPMVRSVNKAVRRGFAHRLGRRDKADALMPSNNNTINNEILYGLNLTASADHLKRVFAAARESDAVTFNNTINETLLLFNPAPLNDTLTFGYNNDEIKEKFTAFKTHRVKRESADAPETPMPSNNTIIETINDETLLRQNCTLLHFFNSFF